MLARQMFGYAPSLITSALIAFASVSVFTSLMSQAEYGQYALVTNAMTMLIGVGFFWLQTAASRLMPQAVREGKEKQLYATLYGSFAVCGALMLILGAVVVMVTPLGDWRVAAWFAAPLAVLRALLNINQSAHRNFIRITRYNVIEIGQAVIGLGAGVALVVLLRQGASGAALGSMIGLAAMAAFDWRMLVAIEWRAFDRDLFGEIVAFGAPFIVTYGLSFILSGSDRFLIETFLGPEQVGIYAAGYAFPDRIGQNLFMAVATASFPLLVRRLEQEGVEAARDQTYNNGVAILALALPACVGLLLANRQIAATLIGPDFRAGAVMIMPWIACATMLNGVAAHYFDHAFHLAKKTRLFFYTLGPAALLNFAGNLYVLPRYGIIGAAWTTLAAYMLYLALSIAIGRRVFRIRFPFLPACQIMVSTAIMALILSVFSFGENWCGLAGMIVTGAAVYLLGMLVFDVMGLRGRLEEYVENRKIIKMIAADGTIFEILTKAAQIENIAAAWQELHRRSGKSLFGDYDWFQIWWRNLGQNAETELHFVVARAADHQLLALWPLAVRRAGLARIVEWAGYDVFDYGDILAVDAAAAEALGQFAMRRGRYDLALIKDVHQGATALPVLGGKMRLREKRKNYFLTLDFADGAAWLAAQSRKLRGDIRRKMEKMGAQGVVAFNLYRNGDLVPDKVIDALYRQKLAWFRARFTEGAFAHDGMKDFLHDLARHTARQGTLYLAWLSCGEAIVACHMGFVQDGVLHLYLTTYDNEYAAFSPGNALMAETIKAACDAGWRELDFMRGDEDYKQRFASGARELAVFVGGRSRLGRLLVWAQKFRKPRTDA